MEGPLKRCPTTTKMYRATDFQQLRKFQVSSGPSVPKVSFGYRGQEWDLRYWGMMGSCSDHGK
jgi:hypothetical protein